MKRKLKDLRLICQTLLDETDTLLLLASQKFKAEYNASSTGYKDKVDKILLYFWEPFVHSKGTKAILPRNECVINQVRRPLGRLMYNKDHQKQSPDSC